MKRSAQIHSLRLSAIVMLWLALTPIRVLATEIDKHKTILLDQICNTAATEPTPQLAESKELDLDYAIRAVRKALDAGPKAEAVALAHGFLKQSKSIFRRFLAEEFGQLFLEKNDSDTAIFFYMIALKEPSLDTYCQFTKSGYQKIEAIARNKGLEQFATAASDRAKAIDNFVKRWRAGTVSDAEAKAWLRPLFGSADLRSQSAGGFYLAQLRLLQKRNDEAVMLAEKAFDAERKYFAAGAPTQERAMRLVDESWLLGGLMLKGNGKQNALPVFQQGLELAKRYPVEVSGATLSDPHRFHIAIAEAAGRPCDDAFNSRFDSALDELTIDGPYSSVLLARAQKLYVDSIKQEADFFVNQSRPDLAVKVYEREIPIMLSRISTPDPSRGAAFANYHAMVLKAQIPDPSNKSVPVCNTCRSSLTVVPDSPQGCVIDRMYYWRCGTCKITF